MNPEGNERLTATVGVVLILLTLFELATLLLGLHRFLSLHVFIGLVLIPPVALKLGSTGWRFTRYYTWAVAYRAKGAPQIAMRVLAPLLVVATVALFGSGVAMGLLHGRYLRLARQLHGPASVAWMFIVGLHVLVYLRRALINTKDEIDPASRFAVGGANARAFLLVAAVIAGLLVGVGTLSLQHRWLHLPAKHDHRDSRASASGPLDRSAAPARTPRAASPVSAFSLRRQWPSARLLSCNLGAGPATPFTDRCGRTTTSHMPPRPQSLERPALPTTAE